MTKKYWLMKSEPDAYSIDDFKRDKKTLWEGVRNYQARNFMIKEMSIGDEFIFYHSNAKPPGVAGLGKVSRKALPDPSALDKNSPYFDPKASKEKPIWQCVEVRFTKKFPKTLSLEEIKKKKELKDILLVQRGTRLSIQPLKPKDFELLCKMAQEV